CAPCCARRTSRCRPIRRRRRPCRRGPGGARPARRACWLWSIASIWRSSAARRCWASAPAPRPRRLRRTDLAPCPIPRLHGAVLSVVGVLGAADPAPGRVPEDLDHPLVEDLVA